MTHQSTLIAQHSTTSEQADKLVRMAVASSRYHDIKNYCIRGTFDLKAILEVKTILEILGEGRFLSSKEEAQIRLMKDLVESYAGRKTVGAQEVCLLILTDDLHVKYALHHYDDRRELLKEIILELPH